MLLAGWIVIWTNSQLVRVEREASIFSMGGICPYSFTAFASPTFSPDFSSWQEMYKFKTDICAYG